MPEYPLDGVSEAILRRLRETPGEWVHRERVAEIAWAGRERPSSWTSMLSKKLTRLDKAGLIERRGGKGRREVRSVVLPRWTPHEDIAARVDERLDLWRELPTARSATERSLDYTLAACRTFARGPGLVSLSEEEAGALLKFVRRQTRAEDDRPWPDTAFGWVLRFADRVFEELKSLPTLTPATARGRIDMWQELAGFALSHDAWVKPEWFPLWCGPALAVAVAQGGTAPDRDRRHRIADLLCEAGLRAEEATDPSGAAFARHWTASALKVRGRLEEAESFWRRNQALVPGADEETALLRTLATANIEFLGWEERLIDNSVSADWVRFGMGSTRPVGPLSLRESLMLQSSEEGPLPVLPDAALEAVALEAIQLHSPGETASVGRLADILETTRRWVGGERPEQRSGPAQTGWIASLSIQNHFSFPLTFATMRSGAMNPSTGVAA